MGSQREELVQERANRLLLHEFGCSCFCPAAPLLIGHVDCLSFVPFTSFACSRFVVVKGLQIFFADMGYEEGAFRLLYAKFMRLPLYHQTMHHLGLNRPDIELQQARVPTLLCHEFLQQQQIVCVWYQPDKYYTNHVHEELKHVRAGCRWLVPLIVAVIVLPLVQVYLLGSSWRVEQKLAFNTAISRWYLRMLMITLGASLVAALQVLPPSVKEGACVLLLQLAVRIAVSNLHKNAKKSFSETIKDMYLHYNERSGLLLCGFQT
ncbi:hypothetical protein TRIUR3_26073 [Triticum urartu]|uniref:Uncharacterized protein n=1 Tax=Triticum urartu TaxID=4572 RepID=M8A7V4_TRIUA|nr:hypothetical protein TRIUR3_26073 [Triticum urartu]